MRIAVNSYAKINLYLDITGRLPDGYHALSTVMQSVSLCDMVTLETGKHSGITLRCDTPGVPADARNTAYKAAELFYKAIEKEAEAEIYLRKNIPSQAGLGGGSGDAAGVLYALNQVYGNPLTEKDLLILADKIGADVPFCLLGGTRFCLNKGEEMYALPSYESFVLLAKPLMGISTKEAFERFDSGIPIVHPDNCRIREDFMSGHTKQALSQCFNVFEQLGEIPGGENIKETMRLRGAYHTSLTGSGSTFYGCFEKESDCNACFTYMKEKYGELFLFAGKTVPYGQEIVSQ